jgi:NADH:ubiquinone oxidoreductase subunit 6 (subunit J)
MTMGRALRKFTFTTHMTSSVAWVGAVVVFLALAIVGLTSQDEPTVRGAYLMMTPAAWFVLVPLAHASLLSEG